jgi:hypothetical protein
VVNCNPRPLYPRYPLYRRPGGPQGRSGRVRKISFPQKSIPEPSRPYRAATPSQLYRRTNLHSDIINILITGKLRYPVIPFQIQQFSLHCGGHTALAFTFAVVSQDKSGVELSRCILVKNTLGCSVIGRCTCGLT